MGPSQSAYCCNYKDKDPHAQDFENGQAAPTVNQNDKGIKQALLDAKDQEDKLVLLQASVRGYLQRKENKQNKGMEEPPPLLSNRSYFRKAGGNKLLKNKGKAPIFGENSFARELSSMPDYLTPLSK